MITVYGIPNCNTVKKARTWLDENNVEYRFHDYKKAGVDEKQLKKWMKTLGWEILLNRKGTTWRRLDDAVKESVDSKSALQIMLENPSIIKRPVVEAKNALLVGFDEAEYEAQLL